MRFRQHGRGDIQRLTNIRQVIEKLRIGEFIVTLVYELFADSAVRHQLCPNSHTRIIHETREKVNYFNRSLRFFMPFNRHNRRKTRIR